MPLREIEIRDNQEKAEAGQLEKVSNNSGAENH
jgi:hypothetical protein